MEEIKGYRKIRRSKTLKRKKVTKTEETNPFTNLFNEMFGEVQSEASSEWESPEVWNHAAYAEIFGLTPTFKKDTL